LVVVQVIESAYCTGTLEVESAGEDRTPLEKHPFRVVEQVVGPGYRVAQSLVAAQAAPRPDEQLETVIETVTDLVHGHRRDARCRQFDPQWDSVETSADLGHRAGIIDREARSDAVGTLNEQVHRCINAQ
jgi:hypothetical protein